VTRRAGSFPRPRGAPDPIELTAPLNWHPEELEWLRVRVRTLLRKGMRRSDASVAAFKELTERRATDRARTLRESREFGE
jgi:hypothetical protein